jgi:hypothetical protein
MQDAGYELPRIPLLGTWVNKGVAVALGTHDGHHGQGAWFRPQDLFGEEELWRPGATPPTPI